jgi:putative ABC transport system substrate-binding protein
MKRRTLFVLLGGTAIAGARPVRARQRTIPLVGVLRPRTAGPEDTTNVALQRGLAKLGYVEGQNILVERRSSDGDNARLPTLAADLVALKPDVILTDGEPAIRAVKNVAGDIPIVMAVVGNPVAYGFAQTLAHPGGNLTGLTNLSDGLVAKRLEMLLEIVPDPGCVAVLGNPGNQRGDLDSAQEIAAAAQALGAVLQPMSVHAVDELKLAFSEMARLHCRALVVMADPIFVGARLQLAELAAQHRIATTYDNRLIVDAGGLMSYGPNIGDMFRRSARYVDKILKGAKPGDLPIEQPTKFELVINLKTAKELGLAVPQALLVRADEVIE